MYPFGSGYPPSQTPYPPPSNQSGYPPANQCPYPVGQTSQSHYPTNNQAPYPPVTQTHYPSANSPPNKQAPYAPSSNAPYPSNNHSSYPPTTQAPYPPTTHHTSSAPSSNTPYPTNQSSYPPNTQAPYPPTTQSSYRHSTQSSYPPNTQAPYPPSNQTPYPPSNQSPYPPSNQTPYPPFGSGMYPPAANNYSNQPLPPMFGFGGGISGMVSQQQSSYPSQSYSTPCPPTSSSQSAYGAQTHNPSPYPTQQSGNYGTGTKRNVNVYGENKAVNTNYKFGQGIGIKKGTPIVVPYPNFDPMADCQALRKAMKGFGTDEDALINIICHRSNDQRQVIQQTYKTNFGKDLIDDIKSETSGNFEKLLVALLTPTIDYYLKEIHDAMAGIGTDEDVLIEVLCSLSNNEINIIKQSYHHKYRVPLENALISETSGHFKRLLVSLCAAGRDESTDVDYSAAQRDATDLLRAGELKIGTDESTFNLILCRRSYAHLKQVCEEYKKISGHTLEKAIKKEFSGDIMEGLLAIIQCVSSKHEFFASRLHKSMAGIGTTDSQLIRVIVTRSEIDLVDVKQAFEIKYGKSLKSWIKGDTSGHYKHCLYEMIGEQRSS